jgi:hypothetical protein
MGKTEPSVGTESEKKAPSASGGAPSKMIWAWNWRGSAPGAAWVRLAMRARRAVEVKIFIVCLSCRKGQNMCLIFE